MKYRDVREPLTDKSLHYILYIILITHLSDNSSLQIVFYKLLATVRPLQEVVVSL